MKEELTILEYKIIQDEEKIDLYLRQISDSLKAIHENKKMSIY